MAKILQCFLIITGALWLAGCQSVQQLSIDYMLPADLSFPNSFKKVAIVNNVPGQVTSNLATGREEPGDKAPETERTGYQGNAAIAAESLARTIANENYFDEVIICDSALHSHKATYESLSPEEVRTLTNDLGVDFLIALEDVSINATRHITFIEDWGCFYGVVDAKVSPTLRIYIPGRKAPLATIAPTDSIFWEETGYSEGSVRDRLVDHKALISQASEFAGIIPVSHLLPSWKTAQRYMFCGGSVTMRDAAVYAKERNWKEANQLWMKQYESKKGKKKMQAALNIALGYEMQDDIHTALEWAVKAQAIAKAIDQGSKTNEEGNAGHYQNYLFTSLYVNELQQRLENFNVLKAQMARFTEE